LREEQKKLDEENHKVKLRQSKLLATLGAGDQVDNSHNNNHSNNNNNNTNNNGSDKERNSDSKNPFEE